MKKITIFLTAIAFLGCSDGQAKTTNNELNKIEVNYNSNKELLDIILLLPDSVFDSWEWKIEDREKWYNEIKSNNFWIDKDTMFFNQIYFKPNTTCFQIVDGSWTVSIYKTFNNSFIVITNDIVDGNVINIYEVKNNKIIENLNFEFLFEDFRKQMKFDNLPQACAEKLIDFEDTIFSFDFSDESLVEIESSWYLTKEKYENCLKGKSILYKFNSKTKKFEFDRIYWKTKNTN
jgi:hypothetical protein